MNKHANKIFLTLVLGLGTTHARTPIIVRNYTQNSVKIKLDIAHATDWSYKRPVLASSVDKFYFPNFLLNPWAKLRGIQLTTTRGPAHNKFKHGIKFKIEQGNQSLKQPVLLEIHPSGSSSMHSRLYKIDVHDGAPIDDHSEYQSAKHIFYKRGQELKLVK